MSDENKRADDALRTAVRSFVVAVRKISEDEAKGWNDGERIMHLARLLCSSSGYDADEITLGYPYGSPAKGAKSMAVLVEAVRPAWWHFTYEALAVLECGYKQPEPVIVSERPDERDPAARLENAKAMMKLAKELAKNPTFIIHEDKPYRIDTDGTLTCLEEQTPGDSAMAAVRDIAKGT